MTMTFAIHGYIIQYLLILQADSVGPDQPALFKVFFMTFFFGLRQRADKTKRLINITDGSDYSLLRYFHIT